MVRGTVATVRELGDRLEALVSASFQAIVTASVVAVRVTLGGG
jgi:hypothetical protein